MNVKYQQITRGAAYQAAAGMSMDPDGRADRRVAEYSQWCDAIIAEFERFDVDENPNRAELVADLEAFFAGVRKRQMDLMYSESRHVSSWIAGPSGYNTRQAEKRIAAIDNKMRESDDYERRGLDRLRMKHDPNRKRPVMSGQADAVEQLTAQLEKAEKLQETMKAVNKILRDKKPDKLARVMALGLSEETANRLLTIPDCFGGLGFPSFDLSNNNANIRRLRERIASVTRLQAAPPVDVAASDTGGVTVTEDAGDNRIRIEFAGRKGHPANEWLKARGWRWSPRNTAWQRQITAAARASARAFVAEWGERV